MPDKTNYLKEIKLFVLDMDGTIYIDESLLNGAKDFIEYLIQTNTDFIFFTNNSSKSKQLYVEKLNRLGISVETERIMTSAEVMYEYLKKEHRSAKVYALGTKSFLDGLTDAGIDLINDSCDIDSRPDVVLVGFDTDLDYNRLNMACHYIRNGAAFLATHPDINCPCEYGYMIDCGAMCEAISASVGGIRPVYTGKPSRLTTELIAEKKGYAHSQLCFVGDRLYTDIACAVNNGAKAALVLSGETNIHMLEASDIQPTAVYEDLSGLLHSLKLIS